jgi:hypothetical protein
MSAHPLFQQARSFVYTETDNSNPGKNAVIAYRQNSDGQVTEIGSFKTTDFEFALDPSGKTLYVIDHQTDATGNFPQGNAFHVLSVAPGGTLSESASSPLFLPSDIPAGADPQGVAVIAARTSPTNDRSGNG